MDDGSGRSAFHAGEGGLTKKASRFIGPDVELEGITERDMDCISLKSGNWTLSLKLSVSGKDTPRQETVFCGYLYKKSGGAVKARSTAPAERATLHSAVRSTPQRAPCESRDARARVSRRRRGTGRARR